MARDRRRFRRILEEMEVRYRTTAEMLGEFWRAARILDLSAGGLRIETEGLLEGGEILELHVRLAGLRDPLILRGRVVWSAPRSQGFSEHGIEFFDLTHQEQGRIDEFVQFLRRSPEAP